jgi:haloalkane dehalogenase
LAVGLFSVHPVLFAAEDLDAHDTAVRIDISQKLVPGRNGQPHTTLNGGSHFIQEDCGEAMSQVVLEWLE